MSYKIQLNNGINCDNQWLKANSIDTSVKLAGEEAKDRLYEPKHKKKLVRVLTVIAYVFFVSLAAIMLSLYYVFLWNGDTNIPKYTIQQQIQRPRCDNIIAEMQKQITALQEDKFDKDDDLFASETTTTTEENITWPDYNYSSEFDFNGRSTFIKKLMYNRDSYDEND